MAFSAHKDEEAMREHYDDKVVLDPKIDQLVTWIKNSKRFLIFTGAGISTSAGIPDFRGPNGVWTLKAQGKARTTPTTPTTEAIPTPCHMAIVTLQNKGILRYLISQNCDGLHRRSGMHPDKMSELHGNGNVEECEDCGKRYFRDWGTYRIGRTSDHFTGRFCSQPGCRGRLLEWTIDFGQNLPEDQLSRAMEESSKGDLHLVLGSSLTVSPACTMPKRTKKNKGAHLVICNLQKTPYYDLADINIHAPCDYVMSEVLKRLGIEPEVWQLRRKIVVGVRYHFNEAKQPDAFQVVVNGVDPDNDNVPATLFQLIEYFTPDSKNFTELTGDWIPLSAATIAKAAVFLRFHFMGHYDEPYLDIKHPLIPGTETDDVYTLNYTPTTKKEWVVTKLVGAKVPPVTLISARPQINLGPLGTHADFPLLPRLWSAAVSYKQDKKTFMINFGGSNLSRSRSYPLIEILDLSSGSWAQLPPGDSDLPYLAKERWGHSATLIPKTQTIYLFGGWDGSSQYNDMYAYDLKTHQLREVKTNGTAPSHRACHSAVAVGKQIVYYGGAFCSGGPYKYYNDVHIFDTETCTWTEMKWQSLSQPPTPTAQHSAVVAWGRFMIVSGGYDGEWFRNDIYCLDLKKALWNKVKMQGAMHKVEHHRETKFRVPPIRSSCFVIDNDILLLYGATGPAFIDMKEWKWVVAPGNFPSLVGHVGVQIEKNKFLLWGGIDHKGTTPNEHVLLLQLVYSHQ